MASSSQTPPDEPLNSAIPSFFSLSRTKLPASMASLHSLPDSHAGEPMVPDIDWPFLRQSLPSQVHWDYTNISLDISCGIDSLKPLMLPRQRF